MKTVKFDYILLDLIFFRGRLWLRNVSKMVTKFVQEIQVLGVGAPMKSINLLEFEAGRFSSKEEEDPAELDPEEEEDHNDEEFEDRG